MNPVNRRFAAPLTAVDTDTTVTGEAGGIGSGGTRVEAVKRIVADDPYLVGHYPELTIYPGVFTIESVHQTVRNWAARQHGESTAVELAAIASVSFAAPLYPGDTMTIGCDLTPMDTPSTPSTASTASIPSTPSTLRVKARCHRADGALAARMTLVVRLRTPHPGGAEGEAGHVPA
ncbi:hypothetical protein AB0O07_04335 [Streptomyces sp. NPDC093085]|uniref:3-hydroxyacyl-ACP dehydratase FabZ family protein n=1 Tax=Streptomyces sp. NPDC093085 TaxID=3155068 RepID=UPI00341CB952